MMFKCNSCDAEYPDPKADGTPAFHVCPFDQVTERAVFDDQGNQTKAEVRELIPNRRDENMRPGLFYLEGKPYIRVQDKNDPARWVLETPDSLIISEGEGRTEIAPPEGSE